jgi:hypothetical protein
VNGERAVDDKPIMTWPDLLTRAKPVADATVRYGDEALQLVDVWVPKGQGAAPRGDHDPRRLLANRGGRA